VNYEVLGTRVDFVNDRILTYEPKLWFTVELLKLIAVLCIFVVAFYTVYSSCSLRAAHVDGKSVYLCI